MNRNLMRKLHVVKILAFVLALTGCSPYKHYYSDFQARCHWLQHESVAPYIVLAGSSTMLFGVCPRLMADSLGLRQGTVVNVAVGAGTPIKNYHIYQAHANRLGMARYYIYSLDPWVFSEKYYEHDSYLARLWSPEQFVRFRGAPPSELERKYGLWPENTLTQLRSAYRPPDLPQASPPAQYGAQIKSADSRPQKDLADLLDYPFFDFSKLQFQYLRKLKNTVEKNGAKFVFFLPNKSSAWVEAYGALPLEVEARFLGLFDRYLGKSVIVGGFSNLPSAQQYDYINTDGLHLLAKGQVLTTLQLVQIMDSLDLLKPEPIRALLSY